MRLPLLHIVKLKREANLRDALHQSWSTSSAWFRPR
jgi:hypothetical protein